MLNPALFPHVPPIVLAHSLHISGWRLDRHRLAATIAAHAPEIDLVDLGG
jgi:hypothetical protein